MSRTSLEASNIKFISWAPQNDVLGHPAVKAFVTHAGSNSICEAGFHGKPVVCIPLLADQFDQAARVCALWQSPHQTSLNSANCAVWVFYLLNALCFAFLTGLCGNKVRVRRLKVLCCALWKVPASNLSPSCHR